MKITFLGAAGEVTGSQHLIETESRKILLDCGLFQGHRAEASRKNRKFRIEPKKLDGLILSHAHIDHSGNVPGLYRAGYRGPIFCTAATADVAEVMLIDSARIQQEDARYLQKHAAAGRPPIEPLYTEDDARNVAKLFEPVEYGEWHELASDVQIKLSDAGHILGSAIVELRIEDGGDQRHVVFTGDLGRRGLPLLHDPTPVIGCDILISESTYGNRVHPPPEDLKQALAMILLDAYAVGGRIVIPAFSLGRTQQVVYFLNQLANEGRLPDMPVFVDSPLSTRLTDVYRRHQHILDDEAQRILENDDDLFTFPGLTYVRSQQESIALNRRKGSFVVISASGMCENGRVRHHLKHAVPHEQNTIAIIGFQAQHTLGRKLVEGQPTVRIFDRDLPLKAKVCKLNGLSAHADVEDFKWWYEQLASETGIGQAFLVHGERDSAESLAAILRDNCDEDPVIPELYQTVEV
jgi:metallo-beta-lactamase family protein